MANDPHRDLLPVREDGSRNGRGFSDKFDYQILGKLSRCELEDRFLRLLDEQTHIKKLANSQEEKIKRLGTKLLRLVNEKKNGKSFSENAKVTEDLHLRIIELEHENYTLKDKNTVLKQQLSTHSRHLVYHRSPIRSNPTSPLMTTRQPGPSVQSECLCEQPNKNISSGMQMQEAESHIRELNAEIKNLHNKIEFLEQNLEKNNLDNIKIKVSENIELIRLQRSLKQQAIQIASLQEQVKNAERSQQILRDELAKAHNENDEALQVIALKQSEIITLCSKLEEKNLNRLEEDELKERIHDLVIERDCLKERSDFLMKSIVAKAEESEKVKELQNLLEEEKCKKEKLEQALKVLNKNDKICSPDVICSLPRERPQKAETVISKQLTTPEKKKMVSSACNVPEESASSSTERSLSNCETESDTETSEQAKAGKLVEKRKRGLSGKCVVDKMKLELELQYLREMLRSQTLRCEAQQAEITRLMYELKLNENKCNDTLQRLDWHLRIFQTLEMRSHQNEGAVLNNTEPIQPKVEKPVQIEKTEPDKNPTFNGDVFYRKATPPPPPSPPSPISPQTQTFRRTSSLESRNFGHRKISSSEENIPSKLVPHEITTRAETEKPKEPSEPEQQKRFVDQTFLDSSDEEFNVAATLQKEPFLKNLEKVSEYSTPVRKRSIKNDSQNRLQGGVKNAPRYSPARGDTYRTSRPSSDAFPSKPYEIDARDVGKRFEVSPSDDSKSVTVTIYWFKIKADSSLWKNENVELIFIDFTFLDMNGAETETPHSVPKPSHPDTKCEFNFTKTLIVQENKTKLLQKLFKSPESALFVFKVVSDSEEFDKAEGECEDLGIALITTKEFLEFCNKGQFQIKVFTPEDSKEVVGTLAVSVEATAKFLNTVK